MVAAGTGYVVVSISAVFTAAVSLLAISVPVTRSITISVSVTTL